MEDTRHWAALALSPEEKMSVEDPLEMERLADALPVERAAQPLDRLDRSGRARRADRPYVDSGFRHLVFHAPGPDQERFLRLYAEEVLPRLRATVRLTAAHPGIARRMMTSIGWSCWRCAACRWSQPGDDLADARSPPRSTRRPCACRPATCWSSRRRSSPRPKDACVDARHGRRRRARGRGAGARDRQGPAPGRGHPVGVEAHRAQRGRTC